MKPALRLLMLAAFFTFTGCVTLYKPNVIHSPLLKEKGELNAAGSLGLSGSGVYNLQAAYAVGNHTGLVINGMNHSRKLTNGDGSVEKLNILFGEAGVGYFTTFDGKKNGLFQIYSGTGYGHTQDKLENATQPYPQVRANFFNVFIQPGMAITNKNFQFAFDVRANYVRIFDIQAFLYEKFEWWNTDFKYYENTSVYFINYEPTLTMKAGGKNLKATTQFGLTIPSVNPQAYFMVNRSAMFGIPLIKFSVGLSYSFPTKKSN